jgi:hypothetical protein
MAIPQALNPDFVGFPVKIKDMNTISWRRIFKHEHF